MILLHLCIGQKDSLVPYIEQNDSLHLLYWSKWFSCTFLLFSCVPENCLSCVSEDWSLLCTWGLVSLVYLRTVSLVPEDLYSVPKDWFSYIPEDLFSSVPQDTFFSTLNRRTGSLVCLRTGSLVYLRTASSIAYPRTCFILYLYLRTGSPVCPGHRPWWGPFSFRSWWRPSHNKEDLNQQSSVIR